MDINNKNRIAYLPDELQLKIIFHLQSITDITKLSQVSKHFYRLCNDGYLWNRLLKKEYQSASPISKNSIHPKIKVAQQLYFVEPKYLPYHPKVNYYYPQFIKRISNDKAEAIPYLYQEASHDSIKAQIIFLHEELYSVLIRESEDFSTHLIKITLQYPETAIIFLKNEALYTPLIAANLLTVELLKHLASRHSETATLILETQKFYHIILADSQAVNHLKIIGNLYNQAALTILTNPILYTRILSDSQAAAWLHSIARSHTAVAQFILKEKIFYQVLLSTGKNTVTLLYNIAIAHSKAACLILKTPLFFKFILQSSQSQKILIRIAEQHVDAAKLILQNEALYKPLLNFSKKTTHYFMKMAKFHSEIAIFILKCPIFSKLIVDNKDGKSAYRLKIIALSHLEAAIFILQDPLYSRYLLNDRLGMSFLLEIADEYVIRLPFFTTNNVNALSNFLVNSLINKNTTFNRMNP